MALDDIDFATDEEIARYESELVVAAADDELVDLEPFRLRARDELLMECAKDGIDADIVDDDGSARAKAMRDWATRLVIGYYWRKLSQGRDSASTTKKAEYAEELADRAAIRFKEIGWPLEAGGGEIVKDSDVLPRLIKVRL